MSNSTNTNATAATGAAARIPPWLWGNNVLGYATEAQLKFHPVDVSELHWRIESVERYEHRAARLVERIEIAAPGGPAHWELLNSLPASPVGPTATQQQVEAKRRELVENTTEDDIQARLNWLHTSLTLAPDPDFVTAARGAYESLRDVTHPDGTPLFPDLAAYFIRFDKALTWRAGFARVMLRIEEEPYLLTNRPAQTASQPVFGSGYDLLTDLVVTRDAYLAPLFLCHSPWIWAIVGPRQQGVMS